ncbi:MAG TPA: hypothetical protein GX528_05875 [Firmicutes bacterium]|nr:hypothetical protein [Bacillota bacterium]
MSNEIPVKEIGELLGVVGEKLPTLLKEVQKVLFSQEGADTMSKAVGTFYKNLMEAGMAKDDALFLTQEYMSTLKSLAPREFKQS